MSDLEPLDIIVHVVEHPSCEPAAFRHEADATLYAAASGGTYYRTMLCGHELAKSMIGHARRVDLDYDY